MDMDILCNLKIKIERQIRKIGVSNTSDHIQIKIKMPNPGQEPPASSNAYNQNLKDIDVLFTFKIKIESHIMGVSKTSENIQIKIKMPNPCEEPPASS